VVKYYWTEARDQFNWLLHLVIPVVASAAGVVVVWKSYFSPFTSSGVVFWGLLVFFAVLAITIVDIVLSLFTFGIWLFVAIPVGIGIWVWGIIDVAVKPQQFYDLFPAV